MACGLAADPAFDQIALAVSRAALDPSAWLSVVREFGQLFPGLRSQIIGWDITQENSIPQYHDGYPEEFVTSYLAHFQYRNPWIPGWSRAPVGKVISDREVLSEADLVRTEFYNDWVKPQEDMRAGIGVVLFADASRSFMLGSNIPMRYLASYQDDVHQLLMRVTPLMQQALEINRTLLGLRLDAFSLRLGIEPLGAAVLVLGEGRTLIHANDLAQELLAAGATLRLSVRGRVEFVESAAQAQLDRAARPTAGAGPVTFVASNTAAAPLVRAVPLAGRAAEGLNLGAIALSQRPSLVLILQFPAANRGDRSAHLRQATGLSLSEADIALALHDGLSLAEIADTRRVSIHTVRNQVKSALSKTGSRRQADLVRLVEQMRQGGGAH
ncbi:MAG TPA: hypothetical protein PLI43_08975 [Albidovulum sp.]|uniref:helix-turn-helix transcriptional regulator n=1 Tax=Albidovulum sp. TaxID=1872424 RepID=UPI002B9B7858|nr:hypothetical protein [Albidovulum sp.]